MSLRRHLPVCSTFHQQINSIRCKVIQNLECSGTAVASCCRWFTLTQLDGSILEFYEYARSGGIGGLYFAWPRPSLEAWRIIATFGLVQALLQLYVPGKPFHGPVSPKGNVPVYKVCAYSNLNNLLVILCSRAQFGTAHAGEWRPGLCHIASSLLPWLEVSAMMPAVM